jgi:DIM1 family U5 snRNP protein
MGSLVLPNLASAWHVDQAILSEGDRVVVIRFGKAGDPDCLRQDDVLSKVAERVKNFAVIYLCDIDLVPDFNTMYGKNAAAGRERTALRTDICRTL